jgi:hypothetical protein
MLFRFLLIAVATTLPACGGIKHHYTHPVEILPELAWSLAYPVPENLEAFRHALIQDGKGIGFEQDLTEFDTPFPGNALDIRYSYGVQKPSGWWETRHEIVRIRSEAPLTYGAIVFRLHQESHHRLVDQDHSFFEGLELMFREYEAGVPAYKLVTGS